MSLGGERGRRHSGPDPPATARACLGGSQGRGRCTRLGFASGCLRGPQPSLDLSGLGFPICKMRVFGLRFRFQGHPSSAVPGVGVEGGGGDTGCAGAAVGSCGFPEQSQSLSHFSSGHFQAFTLHLRFTCGARCWDRATGFRTWVGPPRACALPSRPHTSLGDQHSVCTRQAGGVGHHPPGQPSAGHSGLRPALFDPQSNPRRPPTQGS